MKGFARCTSCVSIIIFTLLAAFSSAQISPEIQNTAKQLAGSVYTGPSMETLRELTDDFGGRLSG